VAGEAIQVLRDRHSLLVPSSPAVMQVIPHARHLPDNRLVVPHEPTETRVLRNMGYNVPSPIHYGYDWNGDTPFKAQKATSAMLVVEPRAFVLSTMGTGKTRSVLFAYDYLRKTHAVRRMLVVAPLSTLNFTWAREVFFKFPKYKVGIVHGSKEKRLKIPARQAVRYSCDKP